MRKIAKGAVLVVLGCLLAWPVQVAAEFVWLDHNGKTRHTKFPPKDHQVQRYISSGQSTSKEQPQVELYVTSWCPYCHKAQKFFRDRGIAVKVYDIEKDRQAAIRKGKLDPRGGVPFAVINGRGIHGYAPQQYQRALQNK